MAITINGPTGEDLDSLRLMNNARDYTNRVYNFWNTMGDEETCRKFGLTQEELDMITGRD